MATQPLLRSVDAEPVPILDSGLGFYWDRLGHSLLWRGGNLAKEGRQPVGRLPLSLPPQLLET
jgi:hypothetical protein